MTQNTTTTYRVELANKVRNGRAVGNLWGVARYVDGRRRGWALSPQENEAAARAFAADATLHVEQEADVRAAREDEQLRKGGVWS